jgi:pimeloyl-ACP methyl ester carboxylesterase
MGLGAAVLTMLAAFEPRLRAFAFVAGVFSYRSALAGLLGEAQAARHARDVRARLGDGDTFVPIFGLRDPLVMFPGEEPFRILDRVTRMAVPRFRNRVPAAVLVQWLELHAWEFARQLPPRPMLFTQGQQDRMSPPTAAAALAQSLGDGALAEWVASRHHFEFYDDSRPATEAAHGAAVWLAATLTTEARRQGGGAAWPPGPRPRGPDTVVVARTGR